MCKYLSISPPLTARLSVRVQVDDSMRMLVRLVLGLFILKAVVAGPRFSRQANLDTYDTDHYDVDLDNSNLENQDIYDYEDGLTIDDPQVRNCLLLLIEQLHISITKTFTLLLLLSSSFLYLFTFNWQLK
ncbi:hypothetical protein EYF80_068367 [Liparis tanakae]|uniref:Uncharacterized protein n=1 Tax=Liparis tanakae TaxID=230148 RepID=A0A4Z2DZE6_9TELE|nr:hypothetical protein EYF80_068367 [Liparis tanakae]